MFLFAILRHLDQEVIKSTITMIILFTLLATFLDASEFYGINEETSSLEKFTNRFYFVLSLFSKVGNCTMTPKSGRAKVLTTIVICASLFEVQTALQNFINDYRIEAAMRN